MTKVAGCRTVSISNRCKETIDLDFSSFLHLTSPHTKILRSYLHQFLVISGEICSTIFKPVFQLKFWDRRTLHVPQDKKTCKEVFSSHWHTLSFFFALLLLLTLLSVCILACVALLIAFPQSWHNDHFYMPSCFHVSRESPLPRS